VIRVQKNIVFSSTNGFVPWGGSESLWSQTALQLLNQGHAVSASVSGWERRAQQVSAMMQGGIAVKERGFSPVGLRPEILQKVSATLFRYASFLGLARWLRRERNSMSSEIITN
jgi:hypothetical protein